MFLKHFTSKYKLYLLFCIFFAGCIPAQSITKDQKSKPIPQISASTRLTVEQMQEDLAYTVRILKKVHPATYHGFSEEHQTLIQSAYKKAQASMKAKEFYFVVNSIICSMHDGHTHLRPMQNKQNRCIDIPLIWLPNGLYVRIDREPFKQSDRIITMGDRSVDKIFEHMCAVISSENEYYSRLKAGELINREEYLDYLNVLRNDNVEIRLLRAGTEMIITVPLKPASQCVSDESSRPWVGYQIEKELSLGIFHLDECNYNEKYREAVKAFFTEVSKNKVRNIAIDVRRNGGGNSNVVDEFIKYLDVNDYKSFSGDIRFSNQAKQQRGYKKDKGYHSGKRPSIIRNKKVQPSHLLFKGNIFVLTSPKTYSSGNWFAVVIKDNNLGTIIGEPTGNQPTSYGDILSFQMPNTGFNFTVSHKKWTRPDKSKDSEDSLYPDVTVYTTIDDIVQGKDPQLEKLKELVRENLQN